MASGKVGRFLGTRSVGGPLGARLGGGQPGEALQPGGLGRADVGVLQPVPGYLGQVWPYGVPHGREEPAKEEPAQPARGWNEP